MPELIITDLDETVLRYLRERAVTHHQTAEAEARQILEQVLRPEQRDVWTQVNALREKLAASGRTFTDSADLLREDRER